MNLKFLIEHLNLHSEEDKEKAEKAIRLFLELEIKKAERKAHKKGFEECKQK